MYSDQGRVASAYRFLSLCPVWPSRHFWWEVSGWVRC